MVLLAQEEEDTKVQEVAAMVVEDRAEATRIRSPMAAEEATLKVNTPLNSNNSRVRPRGKVDHTADSMVDSLSKAATRTTNPAPAHISSEKSCCCRQKMSGRRWKKLLARPP